MIASRPPAPIGSVTEVPCELFATSACGYRDESYDDLGGALPAGACQGVECVRPVEPSSVAGFVTLAFFAVLILWTVRSLRRLWGRDAARSFVEGVNQ